MTFSFIFFYTINRVKKKQLHTKNELLKQFLYLYTYKKSLNLQFFIIK